MANHKSALKRIRTNQRRAAVGGARVTRIRTFIKKVEAAIAGGDREGARAALRMAEPEIMRGSGRVMHRNTAARRVAGLARRIKAMQT